MTLGQKRRQFTIMLARLIIYAESIHFGVAIDYAKRCPNCLIGMQNSCHKVGLAADIHLYRNHRYLSSGKHHRLLHDYWDAMGGAERITSDMNHYSLEHHGVR